MVEAGGREAGILSIELHEAVVAVFELYILQQHLPQRPWRQGGVARMMKG
jgi:hypothetical protein